MTTTTETPGTGEAYDAIVAEAKRLTGLTAPVAVLFFSLEPDEL